MKTGNKRWYRQNIDGTYTRIVTDVDMSNEAGWIRGFPPRSQEAIEAHAQRMKNIHANKEKSTLHRQRMSMAKIGVKKSESHVANMKLAHNRRHLRILEIMKIKNVDYFQASSYEAKLKKSDEQPEWYLRLLNETEQLTEFKDK
jgi:hypothetical protein